jgi:hypothetical protein
MRFYRFHNYRNDYYITADGVGDAVNKLRMTLSTSTTIVQPEFSNAHDLGRVTMRFINATNYSYGEHYTIEDLGYMLPSFVYCSKNNP